MKPSNAIASFVACASLVAACGTVGSSGNQPTITSLSPDHGSVIGGTMVTLTGTNFASGTAYVVVGGHLATNVTVSSSTSLTFVAPAGDQEGAVVDLEVSTSNGLAAKPGGFTYNFKPVVISISPAGGKIVGGTMVTITGQGFGSDGGAAMVEIAGGAATGVTVVNDTTVTATTAAAASGTRAFNPVDVVVTNLNGSGTLAGAFSLTKQGLIAIGPSQRCCGSSSVVYVDPTDGSSANISTTPEHVHGCALGATGQLFVIGSPTGNGGVVARTLLSLDPLTGVTTLIGTLQTAGNVQRNIGSLSFNNGVLFGTDTGNRSSGGAASRLLVSINTSTGQITPIGATAMAIANDNAIASDDATHVFVADAITGTLDTIDTTTSTRAAGKTMSGGAADGVHGLVNTGSGLFIGALNAPIVYSITVGATATLTKVATLNGQRGTIAGLCQTPPSF